MAERSLMPISTTMSREVVKLVNVVTTLTTSLEDTRKISRRVAEWVVIPMGRGGGGLWVVATGSDVARLEHCL